MSVTSKIVSHVDAYQKSCVKAVKTAFGELAKAVASRARQLAPRSKNHRTSRVYPGGRRYTGERRISQSIRYKVKAGNSRQPDSVYALVKVAVGYGVFLEYGTKFMKAARGTYSFTRRALKEKTPLIMSTLKGKWPK
jgi:hypothetical protein